MSSIWEKISGKNEQKERLEDLENKIQSLESDIEEKKKEIESLESEVKREEKKKKKEIREKQEAFEERNRLQDKVSELEDKISKTTENINEYNKQIKTIPKEQSEELISVFSAIEFEKNRAFSAYTEGKDSIDGLGKFSDDIVDVVYENRPSLVYLDSFGVTNVLIEPPIEPKKFSQWDTEFEINSNWFVPNDDYILCVVRSDTFALGKFSDGEMVDHSGFKSRVKSNHSKGGFSQSRFERIRDEQVDEHIEKCKEEINSYESNMRIILGSKEIVSRFEGMCDITGQTDARGKSRSTIYRADSDFWKTRVISF